MNFLQLCQAAHRYIGGGQDKPGTAPSTVDNQQGFLFGIVQSVKDAYLDVLNAQPYWTFMQSQGTYQLQSGASSITLAAMRKSITDFGRLVKLTGDGSDYILTAPGVSTSRSDSARPCLFMPYQQWRGSKDRGALASGQPDFFTVQPDETIAFDKKANTLYSVLFDYRRKAPALAKDTDEPIFSDEHHMVVAWRAVLLWGGTNEAGNKASFALSEYNRIMGDMTTRYTPAMLFNTSEYTGGGS
jgi:hypothetical protein